MLRTSWVRYSGLFSLILMLSSCSFDGAGSMFYVAGDLARRQRDLLLITGALGVLMFLIVAVVLSIAIWRFRVKDEEDAKAIPPQIHGHAGLEIGWTILPLFLLIGIAIPTIQLTMYQDGLANETREDAMYVNVTGYQWWWRFDYLDGLDGDVLFSTANELHIPAEQRVNLILNSGDVLHSFWVPKLAGKKDLIPGQENVLWLIADAPDGEPYLGECAELCLGAHAYMRFRVKVDSQEEFETWTAAFEAAQTGEQQVSAEPEVVKGAQLFKTKGCQSCHTINGEGGYPRYPDLTNYGLRYTVSGLLEHTPDNLAAWIRDPQEFKPGNYMPTLWTGAEGEDADIMAIVTYLQSLGKSDITQALATP